MTGYRVQDAPVLGSKARRMPLAEALRLARMVAHLETRPVTVVRDHKARGGRWRLVGPVATVLPGRCERCGW